ncbi:hypothetical protein BDN72DRAFT_491121 [Pluteus cervinus]|uniref:Uncharacterized protein n=1 Tax=Pluteus cervinus TaxID=181527 RepID=A0ACD3A5B1_9AGAR|nr:hypothetical protein BDN72DRAFT_491121 [Pluteus cervinus]
MRFASYATIVLSFFGAAVALPPGKRASVSDLKTDVHAAFFEINSIYDFLSLEMNPAIPPLLHASVSLLLSHPSPFLELTSIL